MGNKRIRRSRRLGTPSPEREISSTETNNTCNETITYFNTVVQKSLDRNNSRNRLIEPSQISIEIQSWTQIFQQKNNDKIER